MKAQTSEFPRAPNDREREISDFLLGVDGPGVATLRTQAATAQVIGKCACGCATIDLLVDHVTEASSIRTYAAIDADTPIGGDPDHVYSLIAFVQNGYLRSIEIVYYSDTPPPTFSPPAAFDPPNLATG